MFFVTFPIYPVFLLFISPPIHFVPSSIRYSNISSLNPSVYSIIYLWNSAPVISGGGGGTISSSFFSSWPSIGCSCGISFVLISSTCVFLLL